MLILICDAFDKSLPGKLAQFGEVTDDRTRLPDATVALIRSKTKADKEFIDKAPKLKLIIRGGVGLDNVDQPHAKSKGIIVKNTPEASSIAVAEQAFAMMLSIPNRLVEAHNTTVAGKWLKKELKRTELFEKTLGLFGLGRIAVEVAKRAQAFGMKVIGFDPFLPDELFAKFGVRRCQSLAEMVGAADYVSMHTPLTDETRGIINKNTLAQFKKGAVLVNTCRGKCVVEEDIAAALESGQLGAYATDVFVTEPPENTPLLKAKNVLLTPHIAASTKENLLRIGIQVEGLIGAFSKGELK